MHRLGELDSAPSSCGTKAPSRSCAVTACQGSIDSCDVSAARAPSDASSSERSDGLDEKVPDTIDERRRRVHQRAQQLHELGEASVIERHLPGGVRLHRCHEEDGELCPQRRVGAVAGGGVGGRSGGELGSEVRRRRDGGGGKGDGGAEVAGWQRHPRID